MKRVLLRGWPLAAVAGLLVVVALASLGGTGAHLGSRPLDTSARLGGRGPCPDPSPSPAGPPASVAGAPQSSPSESAPSQEACVPPERRIVVGGGGDYKVIQVLFSGVGILGVLVLVALVVALLVGLASAAGSIRVRHRPRVKAAGVPDDSLGDARPEVTAARLGAAVEAGLADLEEGGDPRRAVIAAWRRLELAASAAGTTRTPAQTPAELAARVLAVHAVSPATLDRLADLYREARYSRHEVDERMRAEARRALERLRHELTAIPPRGELAEVPG